MATLWMGDVPPTATEDTIMAAFASHHEHPVAVKMGRNLVSSGNGYCFVTFTSSEHAEKVLTNLNGKPILNVPHMQRFKLNYAAHKAGNQNRTPFGNAGSMSGGYANGSYQPGRSTRTQYSVYVGNLASNISNKALFDLFSTKCPETIVSAHTYLDQMGQKRFGFVNFVDESEIEKALTLDGTEFLSCSEGVPIRVNRTNERNKTYTQQHQYTTTDYSGMGDYSMATAYAYDPSSWYNPAVGAYNMYYNNPAWAAAAAMQQQNPYAGGVPAATAYPGAYPATATNPVQAAGPYGAPPHGALAAVTAAQSQAAVQLSQVAGMTTVPQTTTAGTQMAPPNGLQPGAESEHELVPTDVHRPQDEYFLNRQSMGRDENAYEFLERCRWMDHFGAQYLVPLPNVF